MRTPINILPTLKVARRNRRKRRQSLAELVNLWYVGLNGNAVSRERSLRGPSLRGV